MIQAWSVVVATAEAYTVVVTVGSVVVVETEKVPVATSEQASESLDRGQDATEAGVAIATRTARAVSTPRLAMMFEGASVGTVPLDREIVATKLPRTTAELAGTFATVWTLTTLLKTPVASVSASTESFEASRFLHWKSAVIVAVGLLVMSCVEVETVVVSISVATSGVTVTVLVTVGAE